MFFGIILPAPERDDGLAHRFHAYAALSDRDKSLLEGALLVALTEDPHLSETKVQGEIERMVREIQPLIHQKRTHYSKLLQFCNYFRQEGFSGDTEDYYHPKNSCIDQVLARKRGLPILLSILCIEIGRRCDLPLDGVGLPGHFVVKSQSPTSEYFMDPFHGFLLTSGSKIRAALKTNGTLFDTRLLDSLPASTLMTRMMANLLNSHRIARNSQKVARLTHYLKILSGEGP